MHYKTSGSYLILTIYGTARPKGSMRHVGKGILIESSREGPSWRTAVKDAARTEMLKLEGGPFPLDGPLAIDLTITCNKPASAPKRQETYPCWRSTGDIDKLQRNIFDAVVDAGAIADDSRIVEVRARKCYPGQLPHALETAGTVIFIYKVGEAEQP